MGNILPGRNNPCRKRSPAGPILHHDFSSPVQRTLVVIWNEITLPPSPAPTVCAVEPQEHLPAVHGRGEAHVVQRLLHHLTQQQDSGAGQAGYINDDLIHEGVARNSRIAGAAGGGQQHRRGRQREGQGQGQGEAGSREGQPRQGECD